MSARLPFVLVALVSALAAACAGRRDRPATTADTRSPDDAALVARARGLHARLITIDTHIDIPATFATSEVDPGVRGSFQNDLPKMREGGLTAAFFIVYVGQGERTPQGYAQANALAMQKFTGIRRMTADLYPDQIELAYSADDVERIAAAGKLVALVGVENAYGLGTDLSTWERYRALGARYVSLTHNGHSDFGDAAVEVERLGDNGPEWGGLSPLGREAVAVLNRLGIMVDVSHAHRETMLQTVAASRAPIIASHSSIRAVADHPRNLDDEQLRAIAANNGVAQTTALGTFVKVQPPERAEAIAELTARFDVAAAGDAQRLSGQARDAFDAASAEIDRRFPPATVRDYVDHIDYAVRLVGVDHVGISSDFDGGGGVIGWMDSSETFNVTLELARRGYTDDEIRKLWGGNLLRVMRDVERIGEAIRSGR